MFSNFKIISINIFIFGILFAQGELNIKGDNAEVEEDGTVMINVLTNDNIVDKNNLAIEIIQEPEMGKVQVKNEKILYIPNPNVVGVDKFTYKVDIGTASGTAQVRVIINPVNDAPLGISITKNIVKENASAGLIIGRLEVEDPDSDETFKFGLSKENRDDFSLDGANLLSKRPFDYEKENSFSVTIQVTDSGNEKFIGTVNIAIENQNEAPFHVGESELSLLHSENAGKTVIRFQLSDPDENQSNVKFKLNKDEDNGHFKITRSGDLTFLREPDFELPLDQDKDNIYNVSYKAIDSKDDKLFVEGRVIIEVKDAQETEVIALDQRKFVAWTVDHQPYHILMEDAINNYMRLKYSNADEDEPVDDGYGASIREMRQSDQIIIVQKKGTTKEIHEIWYGNGLDFTIIDRERVDWIFSQDIQSVLIEKDEYLTSDTKTVFHKNETDRLMASYGSKFSVWHANNFKMSLSSFSMRSNLLQYASNIRIGNELIGLPGLLAGSSEIGVATQRSEFGFRVPFAFDFGTGNYDDLDVASSDYLGLYARGNIINLFGTKTSIHGLIGFTFYPSSGTKLDSVKQVNPDYNDEQLNKLKNINILDSYVLMASSVEVPVKLPSIGRVTVTPGIHYVKIAHRLDDTNNSDENLFERTFYDQKLDIDWSETLLNDEGNSFTRLSSFYIRFDLIGTIGEKPKFIERLSFLDFIKVSRVPFYEVSLQYISSLNMLISCNFNITDSFGFSFTHLTKNSDLKGNWMPDSKLWFGLNYRANF